MTTNSSLNEKLKAKDAPPRAKYKARPEGSLKTLPAKPPTR